MQCAILRRDGGVRSLHALTHTLARTHALTHACMKEGLQNHRYLIMGPLKHKQPSVVMKLHPQTGVTGIPWGYRATHAHTKKCLLSAIFRESTLLAAVYRDQRSASTSLRRVQPEMLCINHTLYIFIYILYIRRGANLIRAGLDAGWHGEIGMEGGHGEGADGALWYLEATAVVNIPD